MLNTGGTAVDSRYGCQLREFDNRRVERVRCSNELAACVPVSLARAAGRVAAVARHDSSLSS